MALPAPLPVPSTGRDLLWLDTNGLSPEDATPLDSAALRSPSPSAMLSWLAQASSTASMPLTGQLSPVSPGMETCDPDGASTSMSASTSTSTTATLTSSASAYTDSWALESLAKQDAPETPWEAQHGGEGSTVPKVEAMDDEFDMTLLEPAVVLETKQDATPPLTAQQKVKRPRGRPRKHPVNPVVNANKAAKGRSKTGCITCRKRKKKCDEAKPRCLNCEKNAVVCEGYHEKQIWKSGKEKAEEARLRRESLPSITLQPIFHGVETPEDTVFWKHYCNHLSNVLTVEGEHRNAFKDMVLQLATRHKGLMHSILSLSSRHIDHATPHGAKLIRDAAASGVTEDSLQRRTEFHHEESMRCLYEDIARADAGEADGTTLSARYGQMLCLLLQTQVEGNPRGEHRVHLQAYRNLINHSPPEDPAFLGFITEFFEYHIFADELMAHPGPSPENIKGSVASAEWTPPAAVSMHHPPRLIGVADGLFAYMSRITRIRNTVRANILAGAEPAVDYASLYHAEEINAGIREWMPRWPPGDGRDRVSLLYKQTMWVYLFRTIYPPSSATRLPGFAEHPVGVEDVQVPPSPVSSMGRALDAQHSPSSQFDGCHGNTFRRPSHDSHLSTSSHFDTHEHTYRRPSHDSHLSTTSPPPQPPLRQQPPTQDPRITKAIHESLSILESFKPSDPCQTLLLMPCMVLGTACFDPSEQERIRAAVRRVRGYTGLRKCDLAMEVLEEVWRLAAEGEWMCVWDWQGVAKRLGLDFLCA